MIEITPQATSTIEIIEQSPVLVEVVVQSYDVIEINPQQTIINLELIDGTNIVAEIHEGVSYSVNVEPQSVHTIEISEKVAIKETINNITNNITNNIVNNIDNLVVDVACDEAVFVGAFVYFEIVNSTVKAFNAKADDLSTANVFGVVESKPSAIMAKVRFGGKTSDIFINLDLTKEYYLSDSEAGMMVSEDEIPTNVGSIIVKLGQPFSANSFLYLRGGKSIVLEVVQSSGVMSFGFSGDIALDIGIRTNSEDIIDHGLRFV